MQKNLTARSIVIVVVILLCNPKIDCGLDLGCLSAQVQQLGQYHVAHAKAECWHRGAAELFQQIIVPAPAADRAQFASDVEQLENDASVVRETAHD